MKLSNAIVQISHFANEGYAIWADGIEPSSEACILRDMFDNAQDGMRRLISHQQVCDALDEYEKEFTLFEFSAENFLAWLQENKWISK
jgi:hypothetical protein